MALVLRKLGSSPFECLNYSRELGIRLSSRNKIFIFSEYTRRMAMKEDAVEFVCC